MIVRMNNWQQLVIASALELKFANKEIWQPLAPLIVDVF